MYANQYFSLQKKDFQWKTKSLCILIKREKKMILRVEQIFMNLKTYSSRILF